MATNEITATPPDNQPTSADLSAVMASRNEALGATLLALGKITAIELERARRAQVDTERPLADVMTGLGLVTERDIAAAFADCLDLPIAQRSDFPTAPIYEDELLPAFLKTRRLIPITEQDSRLTIAMVNPMDDFAAQAVEMKLGIGIDRVVALPSELDEALEALYGSGRSTIEEIVDSLDDDTQAAGDDAERLRDMASEAPVIRLVTLLITESVERGASDIHIEPFENRLRVRYRIDGVMHEIASHPSRLRFAIISRIKIMA